MPLCGFDLKVETTHEKVFLYIETSGRWFLNIHFLLYVISLHITISDRSQNFNILYPRNSNDYSIIESLAYSTNLSQSSKND